MPYAFILLSPDISLFPPKCCLFHLHFLHPPLVTFLLILHRLSITLAFSSLHYALSITRLLSHLFHLDKTGFAIHWLHVSLKVEREWRYHLFLTCVRTRGPHVSLKWHLTFNNNWFVVLSNYNFSRLSNPCRQGTEDVGQDRPWYGGISTSPTCQAARWAHQLSSTTGKPYS